jgi:RNase H-fold protein (predicted Holliday junction resolvase)
MESKTVLAIDPGSSKCGFALVRRDNGRLEPLWRAIGSPDDLGKLLEEARARGAFSLVVVGSGTRSQPLVKKLRQLMPSMGILVVDETDTSLHARERYWEQNRRRGWRRLLPATLQVPPEPIDDFVALILAERVLQV